MSNTMLSARLAALSEAFLTELRNNRGELSQLLLHIETLREADERRARLLELTHSLAGRAGTFGFPQLSAAAADVNDVVETNRSGRREAARKLSLAITQVLDPPPLV